MQFMLQPRTAGLLEAWNNGFTVFNIVLLTVLITLKFLFMLLKIYIGLQFVLRDPGIPSTPIPNPGIGKLARDCNP